MLVIGLTGSIGAGKSSVLAAFGRAGAAIASADAFVHQLYRSEAAGPVGQAFPGSVVDGAVDRARLGDIVAGNPDALARLEALVHPMVGMRETAFRQKASSAGRRIAVIEVPLLVETGAERRFDAVATVEADQAIRRRRTASRPGMSDAKFAALAARQATDAERRRVAHVVIDNGGTPDQTSDQVAAIVRAFSTVAIAR